MKFHFQTPTCGDFRARCTRAPIKTRRGGVPGCCVTPVSDHLMSEHTVRLTSRQHCLYLGHMLRLLKACVNTPVQADRWCRTGANSGNLTHSQLYERLISSLIDGETNRCSQRQTRFRRCLSFVLVWTPIHVHAGLTFPNSLKCDSRFRSDWPAARNPTQVAAFTTIFQN